MSILYDGTHYDFDLVSNNSLINFNSYNHVSSMSNDSSFLNGLFSEVSFSGVTVLNRVLNSQYFGYYDFSPFNVNFSYSYISAFGGFSSSNQFIVNDNYYNLSPGDSYQDGYQDGYTHGEDVGYQDGYSAGFDEGEEEGYQSGYDEGVRVNTNSSYAQGYDDGKNTYYSIGFVDGENSGLEKGYNNGFIVGKNEGYQLGLDTSNKYNFTSLVSAVVDVPINTFTSLFNFELLGVNLSGFFLGLLTLCIIITIVKMIL